MRVPARAVKPGRGPAHAQIEGWLSASIARGRLAPGDRLPPERELAARFGVSRMTLRHALEALERRGLVARRVGREGGTFVAEPKLELAGTSALSDQLRGLGLAAGARVLSTRERPAAADERELGARVHAIERVRLADGEPILCDIFIHLFAEHGKPLSAQEYFDGLAGLSDPEIVRTWLGRDHPDVDAVIEERVQRYREAVADGSSVREHVREAIRYAADRVPLAICSGAAQAEIRPVIGAAEL